jgi:putative MATE family efflux protein
MFRYKQSRFKQFFKDVWEALSGTEQDFTEGKLGRAITLLSIPMVLEMVMESTFAIVDIYFVQKLGSNAVAVVGITESLMSIIYAIAWGISFAATSIVSRRIGEHNPDGAAKAAFQSIVAGSLVSLAIAMVGIFGSRNLLALMGSNSAMIEEGWKFPAIMISSNIIIMLLFINNAIFRSSGDAAIAMKVLLVANLINIVLDPCLIFGLGPFPELGVTGAAVATTTGRGLAVIYQFWLLTSGKHRIRIGISHLKVDFRMIKHIFNVAGGGIAQNIIGTASWIFLMALVSKFGSVVVAGYTIAIRIIIFALLPSFGLSNAASTLVGQNLGAGRPDRAEKAVWASALVNFVFLGIIGIFFIFFPVSVVKLITHDEAIIPLAASSLRIIAYGFLLYGVGMVMIQAFNGSGDTRTPTYINFFCFWLFEIPLAWLLSNTFGMQQNGVYFSIVAAESAIAITAMILFHKGKWKYEKV